MKDLFKDVDMDRIVCFFREIEFLPKIFNENIICTIQSNYQKVIPEDFWQIVKTIY